MLGAITAAGVAGALLLALVDSGGESSKAEPGDGQIQRSRPLSMHERSAKRLESRIAAQPGDQRLKRRAIETWIEAGSERLVRREVGETLVPRLAREDYEAAARIWGRYLEQSKRPPDAATAETAASVLIALAEIGTRDLDLLEGYVAGAARAVAIAGEKKRTLFTLSNVAVYAYFNGEYARGDVAAKAAAADAHTKRLHRIAVDQLAAYRERGETFRRLLRQARIELDESGEELLDEPLRAFVHSSGLNKDDPTQ